MITPQAEALAKELASALQVSCSTGQPDEAAYRDDREDRAVEQNRGHFLLGLLILDGEDDGDRDYRDGACSLSPCREGT
jgi:hypothetical protein